VFGCGFDILVQEQKVADEDGFGCGIDVLVVIGRVVFALLLVDEISS
jgi:hypothetical protein